MHEGIASRPLRDPWLIQRCKVDDSKPFDLSMKSSTYLKLDYMGAAEFEFGALPEWQRLMLKKMSRLTIRMVEHSSVTLYVMAEDKDLDQYAAIVRGLIDRKIQTKMGVRIEQRETRWVGKRNEKPVYDDPSMPFSFDVWWDVTNTLAFARSIDVLLNLKVTIANSVKYMDQQAKVNHGK